ncbi:MAG: 30S ribosomal protein S10 [Candidatus Aenigmarchaeota archaeon]|nr:30S ribosomal protein S10 [Candidatus Aenigmarchaeota archaeon]
MEEAVIKLSGRNPKELDRIAKEIVGIAKKYGVGYRGPIPLPTKKLKVTVMANVKDGTGHGNATWEKWEMRIHKRLIYVQAEERVLKQIMRVSIGPDIQVQIKLV